MNTCSKMFVVYIISYGQPCKWFNYWSSLPRNSAKNDNDYTTRSLHNFSTELKLLHLCYNTIHMLCTLCQLYQSRLRVQMWNF